MKKYLLPMLLLLLAQQALSAQTRVDSTRIVRVLSFNILHGATTQGDFDLDAIAKVILETQPDLVALQEVDYQTNRAGRF